MHKLTSALIKLQKQTIVFGLSILLLMHNSFASSLKKAQKLTKQGEALYHARNYEGAKDLFYQAYRENKNNTLSASNLGLIYMQEDNLALAIYWNKAAYIGEIEGSKNNVIMANVSFNSARILEKEGYYHLAQRLYDESNTLNPKNVYSKAYQRVTKKINQYKKNALNSD